MQLEGSEFQVENILDLNFRSGEESPLYIFTGSLPGPIRLLLCDPQRESPRCLIESAAQEYYDAATIRALLVHTGHKI